MYVTIETICTMYWLSLSNWNRVHGREKHGVVEGHASKDGDLENA